MKEKSPITFHAGNIITFNEVEDRELKWLWHPYIPAGMTTMLYGRGGIGKSHIVVDIAARVTTGNSFPGEAERRTPSNVLILSAEDDYGAVLKPRLMAAGADLSRVYAPKTESFVLDPRGIREMSDYMNHMAITFVYIDPVAQFLGGKVDMNRMNEVRQWTGELNHAARQSGSSIVIVHHIKKGRDTADYELAAGSVDFVNAMRSTLYVEKTNDGTRIMRNPKNNNAKEGASITFSLDDGGFQWGEFVDHGVYQHGGPKVGQVRDFIKTYLRDGPVPAVTLLAAAADMGFSKTTLERAKTGIAESFAKRVNGQTIWFWRLKGDEREQSYIPIVGSTKASVVPEAERVVRQSSEHPGEGDDPSSLSRTSVPQMGGGGQPAGRTIPHSSKGGWVDKLDPETIANLRARGFDV